jgi:uncharacterized membrane protein YhaH (DUF805 family)
MLDLLFGFNVRLGRLKFFFSSIALGIVNGLLALPVAYYAYKHGMISATPPSSLWSLGWPILAFVGFCMLGNFMLAAMRFRDIGWDPVIVVPCWIAVLAMDQLIARHVPAMSLPEHDGTIIGGLINFVLIIALLFWPSGDHASTPPAFDGPAPGQPARSTANPAALSSERMAKATAQFGRRA